MNIDMTLCPVARSKSKELHRRMPFASLHLLSLGLSDSDTVCCTISAMP